MNDNRQSAAKQINMKPIKGWEDLYTISDNGQIWSIRSNKYLNPRLSLDGYNRVCLCRDNVRREYRVARLVAEAFISNPDNKPQVNHKDYNTQNDWATNLEWCTNYENAHYSCDANRFMKPKNYKVYTFTNVYNSRAFSIIGINNVAKQFHCTSKNFKAIIVKYANTGMYVKQGIFKGLRIDSEYLKVQRLSQNESTDKCLEVGSPL